VGQAHSKFKGVGSTPLVMLKPFNRPNLTGGYTVGQDLMGIIGKMCSDVDPLMLCFI